MRIENCRYSAYHAVLDETAVILLPVYSVLGAQQILNLSWGRSEDAVRKMAPAADSSPESVPGADLVVPGLPVAVAAGPDVHPRVDGDGAVAGAGPRNRVLERLHRQRLPLHRLCGETRPRSYPQTPHSSPTPSTLRSNTSSHTPNLAQQSHSIDSEE